MANRWTEEQYEHLGTAVQEVLDTKPKGTNKQFYELVAERYNTLADKERSYRAVEKIALAAKKDRVSVLAYVKSVVRSRRRQKVRKAQASEERSQESEAFQSTEVAEDVAGGLGVQTEEVQASAPADEYLAFCVQVADWSEGAGKYDPSKREEAGPIILRLVEEMWLESLPEDLRKQMPKGRDGADMKRLRSGRADESGKTALMHELLHLGLNTLEYHQLPDKSELSWEKPGEVQSGLGLKRVDSATVVDVVETTEQVVQPGRPFCQLALDRDGTIVLSDRNNPEHMPLVYEEILEAKQDDGPQTMVHFSRGGRLSVPEELETACHEEMRARRQRDGPAPTVFHLADPGLDVQYTRQMLRTWDVQADEKLRADLYEPGFL
ncbi:hypothetical protein LTR17_004113 [Elasticomyces elasticus]|nr:hypothetical protein LTR17_004113 [Elasticomyces elasticus]